MTTETTPSKRGRGARIGCGVAALLVLVLLIAGVALEVHTRNQAREQLTQSMGTSETGETAKVHFGKSPLIASAVTKKISELQIEVPNTLDIQRPDGQYGIPQISGSPAATIEVRDLDISDENRPVAAELHMLTTLPDDYLLASIQQGMREHGNENDGGFLTDIIQSVVQVTDLKSNETNGTIEVEFSGGLGTMEVQPHVVNDSLNLKVLNASVFGGTLPEDVTKAITQGLDGQQFDLGNLRTTEVNVTEDGIAVRLAGENVVLSEL